MGNASKLPRFELIRPETVIGRTTITNLQSGIIYGTIGLVDYIVNGCALRSLNAPNAQVVATGGLANPDTGGRSCDRPLSMDC